MIDSLEKDLSEKKLSSARKHTTEPIINERHIYIYIFFNTAVLFTDPALHPVEKVQALLALRQHGTSPDNADPIYSKNVYSGRFALPYEAVF